MEVNVNDKIQKHSFPTPSIKVRQMNHRYHFWYETRGWLNLNVIKENIIVI